MRKTSIIPVLTIVLSISVSACEPDKITGAPDNVATEPAAPAAGLAAPASTASTQGSESIANPADDQARRRCRWVWRHGLVCETKIGTVVL